MRIDADILYLRELASKMAEHMVDEEKTAAAADRLREAIGHILPVRVSRKPFMSVWGSHISGDIGELRGIETVMMDMIDNPEWLHKLLAHMRDGIIKVHREAEAAGHWSLGDHENQSVPYAPELPAPSARPTWCAVALTRTGCAARCARGLPPLPGSAPRWRST